MTTGSSSPICHESGSKCQMSGSGGTSKTGRNIPGLLGSRLRATLIMPVYVFRPASVCSLCHAFRTEPVGVVRMQNMKSSCGSTEHGNSFARRFCKALCTNVFMPELVHLHGIRCRSVTYCSQYCAMASSLVITQAIVRDIWTSDSWEAWISSC